MRWIYFLLIPIVLFGKDSQWVSASWNGKYFDVYCARSKTANLSSVKAPKIDDRKCLCISNTKALAIVDLLAAFTRSNSQFLTARSISDSSNLGGRPSVYFSVKHIHVYGHALLDGVFPLYCMLKEENLLESPFDLLVDIDPSFSSHKNVVKILQFIQEIFPMIEVVSLKSGDKIPHLLKNHHVPLGENTQGAYFTFYEACPESMEYIRSLKSMGLKDNVQFCENSKKQTKVKDFVSFVKKAYKIDSPLIKNRILIAKRTNSRRILNLDSLVSTLKKKGFEVVIGDFDDLSVKDQIIATSQAEYLVGTYGSNLTNAFFLQEDANVVVLWHKYAKYFWSRRYCIIHSAFLSAGVRLIEYDKPHYDSRDIYTAGVTFSDYFFRKKKMNILKTEKITLDAMTNFPGDSMSEITEVDMHIDPVGLIRRLKILTN